MNDVQPNIKTAMPTHIRWMIRRDMPEVLSIERNSFVRFRWTEEMFHQTLRERNCIGMVAESKLKEHDMKIVGFMIYLLQKTSLHVIDFAVDPQFRRMGVGTQLFQKLLSKLSNHRRKKVWSIIPESFVDGLNFCKAMGCTFDFKPGQWDDEDGIKVTFKPFAVDLDRAVLPG